MTTKTRPRSERRRIRGTPESVVRAKQQNARPAEGQAGQVVYPSREAIREAIAAGKCPWCGRGPWRVLASHTHHRHGVNRHELRHLAGYSREVSICDPDVSENVKERRREDGITPPPGDRVERRQCSVCGAKVPVSKRRGRDTRTCSQECLTEEKRKRMADMRAQQPRLQRWSRKHDQCISCGTQQRPHACHGQCRGCYERSRSLERRRQ